MIDVVLDGLLFFIGIADSEFVFLGENKVFNV